ncbi:MAG: Spy/CpxP family protein refolding chaperone [Chloroherpetonaceae bacterium]
MKNLLALVSLVVIVTLTGTGCGDKGQSPIDPIIAQNDERARFSNGILRMIESEVNLSESQKIALKKLSDDLASEMAVKHTARKAEIEAFANAFKQSTLSDADLEKIMPHFFPKEKHASMQAKLVQAHQILTSEQRAKIADKLAARHDRMTAKQEKRKEKKDTRSVMRSSLMLKELTRELDLTDAQQTATKQIIETFQSKVNADPEPARLAHMQTFIREFKKEKMDETVLNQSAAQLDAKQAEVRSAMKEAVLSFHALLTPAQREKASEKLLQMAERQAKFDGEYHGRKKRWGRLYQE